jgi:hypothetical protein
MITDSFGTKVITCLSFAAVLLGISACSPDPGGPSDPGYVPPSWTEPNLAYEKEAYFPAEVAAFLQAPGQYAQDENFRIEDNENKVLGPPAGGGTYSPDQSSVVSLGMAGGSVTLKFDPPIEDHPDNIGGYDFIVFGNSYWSGGGPEKIWQEPGTVWVMKDENGNGNPDDTWYLIPGAHLEKDSDTAQTVTYDTDPETQEPPPADKIETWWPAGTNTPLDINGVFLLPPSLYETGGSSESSRGYCDAAPTLLLGDMSGADGSGTDNSLEDTEDYPEIDPVYFYTTPDDHTAAGIDAGSGGGNAVDIKWAVDPADFSPAGEGNSGLDEVSWIKIVSASADTNNLGDYSSEVDAVARVRRKQ